MKTSEILREAYERLTPERWFQGEYGRPAEAGPGYQAELEWGGGVCAAVAFDLRLDHAAVGCRALIEANDLPLIVPLRTPGSDWCTVVAWNNSPDTTFEDVKLGFKRAIAWAEERGE